MVKVMHVIVFFGAHGINHQIMFDSPVIKFNFE